MSAIKLSSRRFLLLTVAATAASVCAVGVAHADATSSPTVTRLVPVHDCAAPKPGLASCHAVRLVAERVRATSTRTADAAQRATSALPAYITGPAGGYTPGDLATAYGVDPASTTATGQLVAIVDAFSDPNVLAELNAFNAQYGLPAETATSFKVVNQSGAASPLPAGNTKWAGEIALDVQTVRGLCHVCKIVLVEATTNSFDDLATAEATAANTVHATEISNSYGGNENDPQFTLADRAKYNNQYVVETASTGDDGWYGWDTINPTHSGSSAGVPEVPSALSTVIGVGGTTLQLNTNGTRAYEQVWNDNGPYDYYGWTGKTSLGASGGGCSKTLNGAGWQTHVVGYPSLGCGSTLRSAADIAAVADPFTGYDIYRSYGVTAGWYTYGGTSLAAPLIAAMWALAGGPHGVKYPALSLYGHFKSDTTPHLYDVTLGGNGACGSASSLSCQQFWGGNPNTVGFGPIDCGWNNANSTPLALRYQCYARPGYDGPTGVGTPIGTTPFLPLWPRPHISTPAPFAHGTSAAFSASQSTDPFPGGAITQWVWKWGDGTTTSPATATTSHTYAKAGTYTITLTVTDNYARTASTTAKITVS
jgi:subtilase family serine protease